VQFSKNEYAFSDQKQRDAAMNAQPDDFVLIAAEGVGNAADEAGSTNATATALGAGPSYSANGVIATAADVDVYSFTANAGDSVSFAVSPAAVSPNLDVSLLVTTPGGGTLGPYNPPATSVSNDVASGLDASFAFSAPSTGTYYVSIDGVGFGNPLSTGYSDYASLGRYSLTGSRGASLTPGSLSVVAGSSVSVALAGGSGGVTDWVGIAPVGSSAGTYLDWNYLNSLKSAPVSGVSGATVTLVAPSAAGQYVYRYFRNNSLVVSAESVAFTVT
jgi:hypothetical protein